MPDSRRKVHRLDTDDAGDAEPGCAAHMLGAVGGDGRFGSLDNMFDHFLRISQLHTTPPRRVVCSTWYPCFFGR